jgi:putative transposase
MLHLPQSSWLTSSGGLAQGRNRFTASEMQRQQFPLCRRYEALIFDSQSVPNWRESALVDQALFWALGLAGDAQWEVVDAWLPSALGRPFWGEVVDDLKSRGAERVRTLFFAEPEEMRETVCAAFPGALSLPHVGRLERQTLPHVPARSRLAVAEALERIWEAESVASAQDALDALAAGPLATRCVGLVDRWRVALVQLAPFYALPRRLRRHIRSGERIVQRLHRTLGRAIERHGAFADGEAALSFVHAALRRTERDLERPAVANRRLWPQSGAGGAAPEF